jgi:hypothetical protein
MRTPAVAGKAKAIATITDARIAVIFFIIVKYIKLYGSGW